MADPTQGVTSTNTTGSSPPVGTVLATVTTAPTSTILEPTFLNDFILISEFSELVGPVPLSVIPEGGEGKFNLNDFVLRIMAVDYQNKSNDLATFSEDTQVVLSESKESAYAYIHHFTLLDINARGYVRPICMTFITHDSKKIMTHFNDFLAQFTKVANIFKSGNRDIFLRDLEIRIADLKLTQDTLLQRQQEEQQSEDSDDLITATPITVGELIRDLKDLHKKFYKNQYMKDKDVDDATVEEELEKQKLLGEYKPKLIQSFHKTSYYSGSQRQLRSIAELCGDDKYAKAQAKLKKIQYYFSRPSIVLQLEKEDEIIMSPFSSLLTIGQTVLLNFNIEADRHARNIESEAKTAGGNNSASFTHANQNLRITKSGSTTVSSSSDLSSSASPSLQIEEATSNHAQEVTKPPSKSTSTEALSEILNNTATENNPSPNGSLFSLFEHNFSTLRVHNSWGKPPKQSTFNLESFASILWGFSKTNAGRGITDFKARYSFSKHVLFSLLKGRTVLIYAQPTNESAVRKLVTALSIFVPGSNWRKSPSVCIVPWHAKQLKMSDLASIKLIGLSKQRTIPKAVEKYVTRLDYEAETLIAPPYSAEAKILEEIVNSRKQWPDEDTYLGYIHQILFDISTKACMYYHLCCVGLPQPASDGTSNNDSNHGNRTTTAPGNLNLTHTGSGKPAKFDSDKRSLSDSNLNFDKRSLSDSQLTLKLLPVKTIREESKASYFKKINFAKNDIEIIEYLAEVVKEQQALEIHGVDQVTPIIRLDYTPCQVFVNTAAKAARQTR